jgi:predicted glycogen debranching enzyme
LLQDHAPFRASLDAGARSSQHLESIPVKDGHIACLAARHKELEARLVLERYTEKDKLVEATVRFLAPNPEIDRASKGALRPTNIVLLTNGRGGMARMSVDLGRVLSKYDCVLGANLHPTLPVDRHIFAKRIRVWVNAQGFISPLDFRSIDAFRPGPPAVWNFIANAGDGQTVEIQMAAHMVNGSNSTVFSFSRPTISEATGKQLPAEADVRLTVRIDIEDRNFHWETKRNGGADYHFSANVRTLNTGALDGKQAPSGAKIGFAFAPASDRGLRVFADQGFYHPAGEWSENIPHPVEQSRGQVGSGDAYSPGWFELPLAKGGLVTLVVTADAKDPDDIEGCRHAFGVTAQENSRTSVNFGEQVLRAVRAFVVQRDNGKTVIAGYPWFLDWGRDTLICARGLLSAGMVEEVKQLLITFGSFEDKGTLPNTIHGADASNRDTTDAPLWFGLVCEEIARIVGPISAIRLPNGRTLSQVVESIARGYIYGTPNGIRMDPESALIWSPSHFTWMDTNYPAGTPREGYPIEIQALWIRLLRQLASLADIDKREAWEELARKALRSLDSLFWYEKGGYFADVLLAGRNQPARAARADDALRSNCLFAISLDLASPERARRCVSAAGRFLVIPGALRSLAPLPVTVPLPIHGKDGHLLNNPSDPYWGRYEGDEDTRRKPAYHNGTAWTWTFPIFCEALAQAWNFSPEATATARAYLGSMGRLMHQGCLGHIPEVVDGDAPHTPRGCDAQAWGATEALRVWKLLEQK